MSESFRKPGSFDEAVVVYGTALCGFCSMAKMLLQRRGIAYAWVDVSSDPEARLWLAEESGQRTVPQIFIHSRSVGGFTELRALDSQGDLQARVDAAPES